MDINILVWMGIICIIYVIYAEKTAAKRLKQFFKNYEKSPEVNSKPTTPKLLTKEEKETLNVLKDVVKKHELNYMESAISELPDDDILIKELVNEVKDDLKMVVKEDIQEDAMIALKKLGYKQTQIKKAIKIVMSSANRELNSAEIVTQALPILNN